MDFTEIHLVRQKLAPGEDVELARLIEAGVYARHLIEQRGPDPELRRLVDAATDAQERLWATGARIAMQLAHRAAAIQQLPVDDLFQDGCVAVAEAIRRFDHTRGVRFTTFAYEGIRLALKDAVRHRVGRPVPSRWDRRLAGLAVAEMDARRAEGVRHTIESAAAAVGVPIAAVQRALMRMVSIDEALEADPAAGAPFERIDSTGLDFLELLNPRDRRVLELRFGVAGPPLTLAATAAELGASSSTVFRWEKQAIAAARGILASERTMLPPDVHVA